MLNHKNMPGAGSINDTMEFMRKMWGSMGSSSMGIPTLSVEEINKKIADLKTVASWLELNMNMLRATIQTLEVQSATLSTLQAMGAILTPQEGPSPTSKSATVGAFGFPAWPPQASGSTTGGSSTGASTNPWAKPEQKVSPEQEDDNDDEPEDNQAKPNTAAQSGSAAHDTAAAGAQESAQSAQQASFQSTMGNPNAWWNLLQEQFQQAVGTVLAETPTVKKTSKTSAAASPKKTTKAKAATKAGTREKAPVVQSRKSKPAPRKPKSP